MRCSRSLTSGPCRPARICDRVYRIVSRSRLSRIAARGVRQLARGVGIALPHVRRGLIELVLERRRLRLERLLAIAELLDLVDAVLGGGAFEALHALGNLLLIARHLLGLTLRVGDVTRAARALRLLQLALRVLQPLQRGGRLRRAHLAAVGRRLPHLVGRLAHPSRGIHQIGAVLFARQLLEPPRRFLDLIGQLPLAARRRPPRLLPGCALAQALGLLLLPAGQLLQLLRELVDLLIRLLLLGALRGLVLVGHLVHLELEQVGQILGHLALPTAAATAAALALHADLDFVLLLGFLQDLQRLLLERDRAVRARLLQLRLGRLHLRRRPAAAAPPPS